MGNSFLNEIARKVVETYIARNAPMAPIAPQPMPITHPIVPVPPPIVPSITPPIVLHSPIAHPEGIFVSLPVTPPNERVSEIDFKHAEELEGINQRSMSPEPNRAEAVDAIYNRLLTAFPLFPDLSPREESAQSELGPQVLETVPITPTPSAPISPASPDPFVVVDLSR